MIANSSQSSFENFQVGVAVAGNYRVVLNSDSADPVTISTSSLGQHSKPFNIPLPQLGSYGVIEN